MSDNRLQKISALENEIPVKWTPLSRPLSPKVKEKYLLFL
jgi:hypothetical protein